MFNENKARPELSEQIRSEIQGMQQELAKLTTEFEKKYSDSMFQYISEADAPDFLAKWEAQVRQHTTIFESADELGISAFDENIDIQPNLQLTRYSRNLSISFDPNHDFSNKGEMVKADAQIYGKINIAAPKPSLREQLFFFIQNGKLHPVVENLIHELIHEYHYDENLETAQELGESQAYANGVIENIPFGTLQEVTEHIARDYGFPENEVDQIIRNIILLYALGESTKSVANMIRSLNPSLKGSWAFEKYCVQPVLESHDVSEADRDLLVHKYQIKNEIERMKARLLFVDMFGDWMADN